MSRLAATGRLLPAPYDPSYAWIVSMWYGSVYSSHKSNYSYYYVWPVRSGQSGSFGFSTIQLPMTGQTTCYDSSGNVIACTGTGQDGDFRAGITWPDPRFTDNGNGTVTDDLTGLVWTKDANAPGPAACSPGVKKTWQASLDYVACLNTNSYLGYSDWRLPNINEGRSLVHVGESSTRQWFGSQGFNNVDSFWSSTTNALNTDKSWVVDMWSGYMGEYSKSILHTGVWPVRSGQ